MDEVIEIYDYKDFGRPKSGLEKRREPRKKKDLERRLPSHSLYIYKYIYSTGAPENVMSLQLLLEPIHHACSSMPRMLLNQILLFIAAAQGST
jgi:hypothetical protein